jgi:hypothetical protein
MLEQLTALKALDKGTETCNVSWFCMKICLLTTTALQGLVKGSGTSESSVLSLVS